MSFFQEEHFQASKVFLKAYKDAIDCIKESVQQRQQLLAYSTKLDRVLEAKEKNQIKIEDGNVVKGEKFEQSKEFKLFTFSNTIFEKYFKSFQNLKKPQYSEVNKILEKGIEQMTKDVSQLDTTQQSQQSQQS